MRLLLRSLALVTVLGLALLAIGYATAISDPVVRRAHIGLRDWPAGAAPVRAVLISDIHVAGPDMPPERLQRIVRQINALEPDLVFIAGDLVSDGWAGTRIYSTEEAIAPLRGLDPRIGTFAVLGNHDHWRSEADARRALERAGITFLDNNAAPAGPLAIGGLDDAYTEHDDLRATIGAMRSLPGAKVMISHSPDPFAATPSEIGLVVAGHTHCGQISLPLIGPLATFSKYGNRYACGIVKEGGQTLVVAAGLGTSMLPLRLGAAPDLWFLELGALRSAAAR